MTFEEWIPHLSKQLNDGLIKVEDVDFLEYSGGYFCFDEKKRITHLEEKYLTEVEYIFYHFDSERYMGILWKEHCNHNEDEVYNEYDVYEVKPTTITSIVYERV